MALDNQIFSSRLPADAVCHWFEMEIRFFDSIKNLSTAADKAKATKAFHHFWRLTMINRESLGEKHKKSISILSKWSMNKELNAHKRDTGFM